MIKCPACWNELEEGTTICPNCGFVLGIKQETETPSEKSYLEPKQNIGYNEYTPITKSSANASKNKKIIGSAIVAIVIILIVAGINSNNKTKKYDYSGDSYSPNNSGYSSSSYVKTGKKGALNKAKSYLNSSAFSYAGLIEQLEYEGFTNAEATYGADNCGANWKEQALKKAKSYLNTSSFSYSGLIEQLEYEGFTSEQATYGADNCGANWKEQAVKKAASYLRSHSFTRSDLIDQLEYEGFTYEQAKYGAEKNGL